MRKLPVRVVWRPWVAHLGLLLAYYAVARLGLFLASATGNNAPIWPGSGVAIAATIVLSVRAVPFLVAGGVLALVTTGLGWPYALAIAVGNGLEACAGAGVFRLWGRRFGPRGVVSDAAGIVVVALVAPLVSASIGAMTLERAGLIDPEGFLHSLLAWWAADAVGALTVLPPVLTWLSRSRPIGSWSPRYLRRVAAVGLCLCLAVIPIVANSTDLLGYMLLFPVLLLAAGLLGTFETQCVTLVAVAVSVVAASQSGGPFLAQQFGDRLLLLDLALATLAITGLLLSSLRPAAGPIVPAAILLAGWLGSAWLLTTLREYNERAIGVRFDQQIAETSARISRRLDDYVEALRGGTALHAAAGGIDAAKWESYAGALRIEDHFPGATGLGVVLPIAPADIAGFVRARRAEGEPLFDVKTLQGVVRPTRPPGAKRYVITYITPVERNRPALGLDLSSEALRLSALSAARDTGKPHMTGQIGLVHDALKRPGFLLCLPYYNSGEVPPALEQRRALLAGWICAPFVTEEFFAAAIGASGAAELDLTMLDTRGSAWYATSPSSTGAYSRVTEITLAGQNFRIGWRRPASWAKADLASVSAAASLSLGALSLAGLVVSLQNTRRRAEALANAATADLRILNEKLQLQVQERELAEKQALAAREVAESANRAKRDFLATMSHELRTPLNSVVGFAHLLRDSPLEANQREWVAVVDGAARALLSIISDTLDFSKIESGKVELERLPFLPEVVVEGAIGFLAPPARSRGLAVGFVAGDGLKGLRLVGDADRFRQIVVNLVSNAIKFTPQGSVEVTLQWRQGAPTGGELDLSVRDTGIGMGPETLAILWSEFSQADSSTTRRYGGTGLGLAIAKRLVDLMDGNISVESRPGAGTCFRVRLPFSVASDSGELLGPPAPDPAPTYRTRKVLVVEDSEFNRMLAVLLLEQLGCEVDVASNGLEAVERVLETPYECVFMDCQMPELDGFDASRRIRQSEQAEASGRAPHVPIVAMTANAVAGDRERCLAAGMDDYLAKPIDPAELGRILVRWTAG